MRFAAHEMGHGYGLDHPYSKDQTYQNASWSEPGEYADVWAEMSVELVNERPTGHSMQPI